MFTDPHPWYVAMWSLGWLSMGFATTMFVKDAYWRDWARAGSRLAYVGVMAVLMPLINQARQLNIPFTWESWLFLAALAVETTSLGFLIARKNGYVKK